MDTNRRNDCQGRCESGSPFLYAAFVLSTFITRLSYTTTILNALILIKTRTGIIMFCYQMITITRFFLVLVLSRGCRIRELTFIALPVTNCATMLIPGKASSLVTHSYIYYLQEHLCRFFPHSGWPQPIQPRNESHWQRPCFPQSLSSFVLVQ